MDSANPAGEWLHLLDRYRRMSDDELLNLSRERSGLTDFALQP